MPRSRRETARVEQGTVRLTGRTNWLIVRGPSGTVYTFERGIPASIHSDDWDWIDTLNGAHIRFEILVAPSSPVAMPFEKISSNDDDAVENQN